MMKVFCGCFRIDYEKIVTLRETIQEDTIKVIEEYKRNIINTDTNKIKQTDLTKLLVLGQIDYDKGQVFAFTKENQNAVVLWLDTGEPVMLIFPDLSSAIIDIALNGKPKLDIHMCVDVSNFPIPKNLTDSGNLSPFDDISYVDVDTFKGEY